ncbi:MAG TPA: cysteine--tRNA ligase [Candidatus Nitrosocosmicus sp.]|jgi:cysteinyl-tRNA synthetase|nr:cysteine--tRNA ligase [Candidatus Nitrosocosmicus sp.]
MKLSNTLSNKLEEIKTTNNTIKIYLCGVTVYDDCHIGHARTIIVFDVLRRLLEFQDAKVIFIQNFTDIDDKIIARASKENTDAECISKLYTESYFRDFDALNVMKATSYPKVTEHIPDIIEFINKLIKKNKAYVGLNGIYFKVRSYRGYGKLSKKDKDSIISGARIEVDETKDDPRDFALWKFSSEKPTWHSPWGNGRPGWHIECSVMASKYLGANIDIHGGGQDLIFPHHENEIAQSEGLFETQFSKLWMHVGMVTINSEKMSKSIGNTIKISELIKEVGPNVIRLFCLSSHYTKPLDYTQDIIIETKRKWNQISNAYYELEFRTRNSFIYEKSGSVQRPLFEELTNYLDLFEEHLNNDLNFANAMMVFLKFVTRINNFFSVDTPVDLEFLNQTFDLLKKFMFITGLKIQQISQQEIEVIEEKIYKRNSFRSEKNYLESDKIRLELADRFNIELIDHRGFTLWKKRSINIQK